jgi:ASC-1-like (ASCH) protein
MNSDINERFHQFISTLSLQDISIIQLHSERSGELPPHNIEVQLEWKQMLADGDPLKLIPETRVFRPKYELSIKQGKDLLFRQTSVFVMVFSLKDATLFEESWKDEELKKIFIEKQLRRIIWPLFRQQVHDGMSRLGMPPIPLPLLM